MLNGWSLLGSRPCGLEFEVFLSIPDHLHEGILVTQLTELFHAPSPTRIRRKLVIEFLPVPNSGLRALVGLSTGNEDLLSDMLSIAAQGRCGGRVLFSTSPKQLCARSQ